MPHTCSSVQSCVTTSSARTGQRWTVEKWLTHWVVTTAAPWVRETIWWATGPPYNKHLIPGVGAHRLNCLEPERLEELYAKIVRSGRPAHRPQPLRPGPGARSAEGQAISLNGARSTWITGCYSTPVSSGGISGSTVATTPRVRSAPE